ncbi:DUF1573 domain-containing protein [uncultured Rikenella sp.]|uniref:DUF1573 domain-containing protein n=1 Tax=uncultured Rikenella sp. TaxID=368003 RepID=UPI002628C789|nr:DUF1573 domain-containing protein [uncultured Rikenella sp.]
MRRGILGIFFACSVCCGAVACGGSPAVSGGDAAEADLLTVALPLPDSANWNPTGDFVSARSYDTIPMGRIAEGDVVEGRFRVANVSDKPLVIIQVITGCGCTTADYDPAPIAAGDTVTFKWRFDSRGRYGQQFKSIEIITAERQCATVYLDGEVYMPGQN